MTPAWGDGRRGPRSLWPAAQKSGGRQGRCSPGNCANLFIGKETTKTRFRLIRLTPPLYSRKGQQKNPTGSEPEIHFLISWIETPLHMDLELHEPNSHPRKQMGAGTAAPGSDVCDAAAGPRALPSSQDTVLIPVNAAGRVAGREPLDLSRQWFGRTLRNSPMDTFTLK